MKNVVIVALLAVCSVFAGCGRNVLDDQAGHQSNSSVKKDSLASPERPANTLANPGTLDTDSDTAQMAQGDFWSQAAAGGMAEVELSRLALATTQNPEVRAFAQMMVTDHSTANQQLQLLASRKNVELPAAMDAKHQAIADQLRTLKGAEFDRAYVDAMVQDHQMSVNLFQSQAQSGADADAKAFAATTLPVLQQHLDAVRSLQGRLQPANR